MLVTSRGELVTVRVSHYEPWQGGINCFLFVNGKCLSGMSSGERWENWIGRASACVKEWPFWARFTLPGGEEFICLDRGGAIVIGVDGLPWVDLLVETPPVPFGTPVQVSVIWP